MSHLGVRYPLTICSILLFLMFAVGHTSYGDDAAERLFTLKVLPVFKEKCLGCHGNDADDLKGDFDIRSRKALLKGGESEEPSIVPGRAEESILYQAIMWDGYEMPPKENDRLNKEQISWVRDWIKSGAVWPSEERQKEIQREEWSVVENADGRIVTTSGGQSDEWTYRRYQPDEIWAFQPVSNSQPPVTDNKDQHPIDAFIQAKLKKHNVSSAAQANPRTLIRRATYDLTGLPPTPQEIEDFLAASMKDSEAAWLALIDRLLASPHYGEHWGQHWLDVVRYADTGGMSNDYERSNAWRYRDYVIRSFNEDKPYNDFILEQIAGDELRPDDPEAIIATGFLRMGPWDTAMVPQEEAQQIYRDDVVHSVGQSFLSMPMRCCKCHDHKFDPLPTRDYYRMYAAFSATQPAEVDVEFLPEENRAGFESERANVQRLFDIANREAKRLQDKREKAAKAWYKEHDLPYKNEGARKNDPEDMKPIRHVGLTPEEQGILKVREQDVWIWQRRLERFEPMAQSVYNGKPQWFNARKLRPPKKQQDNWKPESFVHEGGDYQAKGEQVQPGVLSVIGLTVSYEPDGQASPEHDPYLTTSDIAGRRLEFAKWVAHPKNSLSTRSIVNRIWQYHFGEGIVRTPNNFGVKGDNPTHLALLDWLANNFVENKWTMKRMHKLIMTSAVYKQATTHPQQQDLANSDPENLLFAYFPTRRLTAEEIRDSMLLLTGELNPEMGGLPIRPEINMEVALQPRMIQFSLAPAYQPSPTPEQRNRRSIYAYQVRGQADPFMEIMNKPGPNDSCDDRQASSVSPQAFTLLNSDVMTDRSIALAKRLQKEEQSLSEQVLRAVQLVYGRTPSGAELKSLEKYVKEMQQYHAKHTPEPTNYPEQITRSLVEEFTGQPFEYTEILTVFENYTPDTKPTDVSPETRALADLCLILFNSNEFMFVY